MATVDERLNEAADKAENASEILRKMANDPAGTYIQTDSGLLPSLAQWLEEHAEELGLITQDLANQSDATKGSALVARSGQVVFSISALRDLKKDTPSKSAFVMGYYEPGDGGGGAYNLVPGDTTSADNGGSLIVATDGGRWRISSQNSMSVKQWGARGDGSTDDSAAFNTAVSEGVGTIRFTDGQYLVQQSLILRDHLCIEFDREAEILQGANGITIFLSNTHAYFCKIQSPRINGNGLNGGVAFNLKNFRLMAGIYDCYLTDIETGAFFVDGCFGAALHNLTAYHGVPNPIVVVGNAAVLDIVNPNLDNITGRWAGQGYGIQIQNAGTPNEGVRISGGYSQGFIRGLWDKGRGTRLDGMYFEQCSEADVYAAEAYNSSYKGTQHYAEGGPAAYKLRECDGCSIIDPNMASGCRDVLYDVDSTNTNCVEYRTESAIGTNIPTGSLENLESLAKQRRESFIPVIDSPGVAYSGRAAKVVKTGSQVHVRANITWTGGNGTSAFVVNGLPARYTPTDASFRQFGSVVLVGAPSAQNLYCELFGGGTSIRVIQVDSAGAESLLRVAASGTIMIDLIYDVS